MTLQLRIILDDIIMIYAKCGGDKRIRLNIKQDTLKLLASILINFIYKELVECPVVTQ